MSFQFDTSGCVPMHADDGPDSDLAVWWSDLTPFAQGYIEGLLGGVRKGCATCNGRGEVGGWVGQTPESGGYETALCPDCPPGFSDLRPEALALILRDCVREAAWDEMNVQCADGMNFWDARQRGLLADFPPLHPFLSDDGRVCLRPASETQNGAV